MISRVQLEQIGEIQDYLDQNFDGTFHMRDAWNQMVDAPSENIGDYYTYTDENTIKGIMYFKKNQYMLVHYTDERILNKVDFLKVVKQYKPRMIKSQKSIAEGIYRLLCRTMTDYQEEKYVLMMIDNLSPMRADIGVERSWRSEFINSMQFFMKVERSLGRNPKSYHDLMDNIRERAMKGDYAFITVDDMIVSQAMIEQEGQTYGLLGGVYTLAKFRGEGYGYATSYAITNAILRKNKKPMLFVYENNKTAIDIYQKMGYKIVESFVQQSMSIY